MHLPILRLCVRAEGDLASLVRKGTIEVIKTPGDPRGWFNHQLFLLMNNIQYTIFIATLIVVILSGQQHNTMCVPKATFAVTDCGNCRLDFQGQSETFYIT